MTFFKYSVIVNNKVFANFHKEDKKDAISLGKTLEGMNLNDDIKVVENNEYPTIHGYHPKVIKQFGTSKDIPQFMKIK